MSKINPFEDIENRASGYEACVEYLKGCSESEVKEAVDKLVAYVEKYHRYSMSRVYSLWNFLFSRNETPQACASCLIRKGRDIIQWKEKQELQAKLNEAEAISRQSEEIIKATDNKSSKRGKKEA